MEKKKSNGKSDCDDPLGGMEEQILPVIVDGCNQIGQGEASVTSSNGRFLERRGLTVGPHGICGAANDWNNLSEEDKELVVQTACLAPNPKVAVICGTLQAFYCARGKQKWGFGNGDSSNEGKARCYGEAALSFSGAKTGGTRVEAAKAIGSYGNYGYKYGSTLHEKREQVREQERRYIGKYTGKYTGKYKSAWLEQTGKGRNCHQCR